MIQALGKVVRLQPKRSLTTHDFYLPLTDVLLDLVERDPDGPLALRYSQLACSFAHDFVNLATIAGQLLWYVAVAPVRTGTPDSIDIHLAAESYLIFLRTAYDVISMIIVETCVDPKKRGQIPKGNSFNDLINWANDNSSRLPDDIAFLPKHLQRFMSIRGIRDKLMHHGYDLNVYTNDVAPSFGLMSTGEINLHFLRTPGKSMGECAIKLRPLLPFLKESTEHLLRLADEVCVAIVKRTAHTPSRTHVINGVYIPALNHILSFEEPTKQELTPEEKARRKIKAWFCYQAGGYLESLNFGYPDAYWLVFATHASELFGCKPVYFTKPKHPPYRDSELLMEWWLVFEKDNTHYGVLLMDGRRVKGELAGLSELLDSFKQQYDVSAAVVVCDCELASDQPFKNFIAASDPFQGAQKAFNLMTRPAVESDNANTS